MLIPRHILALSLQAAALLTTLVTIAQAQPRSVPVAPGALVRRLTHVADSAGLAALTPLPARAGDDPEDALLFRATVARLRVAPDSAAPLYFACALVISQRENVLTCDPDALPLVMRNCLQRACGTVESVNDVWMLAENLMMATPQSFKVALHKVFTHFSS